MSNKQRRSAVGLIKAECANYVDGQCVPLDTPCPQCHSYSLICKWFAEAVLPLDKALHADIMGGEGVKQCAVCNALFRAVSNRAKYCAGCAKKAHRRQKTERQREYRAG